MNNWQDALGQLLVNLAVLVEKAIVILDQEIEAGNPNKPS